MVPQKSFRLNYEDLHADRTKTQIHKMSLLLIEIKLAAPKSWLLCQLMEDRAARRKKRARDSFTVAQHC